jgi:hypothetical protein
MMLSFLSEFVLTTIKDGIKKSYIPLRIFHIRTVHLDIINILFIHQMMHKWVVLKNNIKIYIKTPPTCFGAVTPSSDSSLIRAY